MFIVAGSREGPKTVIEVSTKCQSLSALHATLASYIPWLAGCIQTHLYCTMLIRLSLSVRYTTEEQKKLPLVNTQQWFWAHHFLHIRANGRVWCDKLCSCNDTQWVRKYSKDLHNRSKASRVAWFKGCTTSLMVLSGVPCWGWNHSSLTIHLIPKRTLAASWLV